MTTSFFRSRRALLIAGVAPLGLTLALAAAPACAQDQTTTTASPTPQGQPPASSAAPVDPQAQAAAQGDQTQDVVVTGTLFRRTNTETPSPVTVLSAQTLDQRGITNAADAIRSITSDSSGSVPSAFSGGFAAGAQGVSLRGLSVNSTLTLFDGLRAANYPLADDGERSFVDLNTIPDAIIDRIEVLKDGASATYGSDAIAGVVNIITKKQIKGIMGRVEGGVSERGDGGHQRVSLTAGYGDLDEQRFNVYLSGEYQHDGLIMANQRGFPYNTRNLSSIGGRNRSQGGAGSPGNTAVAIVRPATYNQPGNIFASTPIDGTFYQPLGGSCGNLITHTNGTGTYCEEDLANRYATLQPDLQRYGATGRLTVKVGDNAEAYASATYYHSRTFAITAPSAIQQGTPIDTTTIALPALLANGQLNPNNPFAASGQAAFIYYRFEDIPASNTLTNKTIRGAVGIAGTFGDGWNYSFDATGMKSTLDIQTVGALNIAGLTNAINTGTYNFINPSANTAAVRQAIAPTVNTRAQSELYLAQASIGKDLFQLPGGPFQVAVGGAIRHEKLNDPNQNATNATLGLNTFSAVGNRTVEAGYFEINAPVLNKLELNVSGRYDHYSEGFSHFSPKAGFKFTPIRQFAIRGTYSEGFRAPSIPEVSGAVIGYAGAPPLPQYVIDAHGNDGYVQPYNIGYNTAGTPGLRPETSRSFTGGVIVEPTRWLSLTVDYYNIKKKNYIVAGPNASDAIAAYYANPNNPAFPAGYTVTLNTPDPNFPNAIRTIKFVNSPYVNAGYFQTSGIDFQAQARVPLATGLRFIGSYEATEIFYSRLAQPDGKIQSYVGTEGPYQVSSSGGTPRWRFTLQNTLEYGPLSLTGTVYYVDGYKETSDDTTGPGTAQNCANDLYARPAFCRVKSYTQLDVNATYKVNDDFSFYVNVQNALDVKAPINPANYGGGLGGANYNPAFAQEGVVGRFFRAGATFKF